MWAQPQQFRNAFDGPCGVQQDLPGGRVPQPGRHVAGRKGHALNADEILKDQLRLHNLLGQLAGAVRVAAESVRDYRRQIAGEFRIGQQRQYIWIALIQPLGHDAVESRRPPRYHGGKDWATWADDATGFTKRLDPVGSFPKVVERTKQHYRVDR